MNSDLIADLQALLGFMAEFHSRPLKPEKAMWLRQLDEKIAAQCVAAGLNHEYRPEEDDAIGTIGFCRIPCQRFTPIRMKRGRSEVRGAKRVLVVCRRDGWEKATKELMERANN